MKRRHTHSLNRRLQLFTLCSLLVFLGLAGLVLQRAFSNSQQTALQQRMESQLYLLLGAAELNDGRISIGETLSDPRFNQVDSGIYGLIQDSSQQTLWRSASAVTLPELRLPDIAPGEIRFGQMQQPSGDPLYSYQMSIIWEDSQGQETPLNFAILQDSAPTQAESRTFSRTLWLWFGLIVVILLASLTAILRWGLRPLDQLANDLKQIEAGNKARLEGDYPDELNLLTENLNRLLQHEQQQRTRYQHTLDDLAHSLKTPLAVVRSSLEAGPAEADTESLQEQVNRMDEIIRYQLNRASTRSTSLSVTRIPVKPELEKLLRTLSKVYRDKDNEARLQCDQQSQFRGSSGDLLELMGNITDNAFKAALHRIEIHVNGGFADQPLQISVEDDGTGIAESEREQVVQRGIRADSRQSGQGIGLAVAADIMEQYQGQLLIDRSPSLGGARIQLIFGKP